MLKRMKLKALSIFNKYGYNLQKIKCSTSQHFQITRMANKYGIGTIIDVGANEGQTGLGLRSAGYSGKIISVEPLSAAHNKLVKKAKHDKKWTIYRRVGLGRTEYKDIINISENSVSSSFLEIESTHVEAAPTSGIKDSERVEIITIESLLSDSQLKESCILKIDTQGYELEVLEGIGKYWKEIKIITMELSLVSLYKGQPLAFELIEYLENKGYSLAGIYGGFCNEETGNMLQFDATFLINEEL